MFCPPRGAGVQDRPGSWFADKAAEARFTVVTSLGEERCLHSLSVFQATHCTGRPVCRLPAHIPWSQGGSVCLPRVPLQTSALSFKGWVLHSMWSAAFSADVAGVSLETAPVVSHLLDLSVSGSVSGCCRLCPAGLNKAALNLSCVLESPRNVLKC